MRGASLRGLGGGPGRLGRPGALWAGLLARVRTLPAGLRRLVFPLMLAVLVAAAVLGVSYGVRGCRQEEGPEAQTGAYVPPASEVAPATLAGGRVAAAAFEDIPVVMTQRVCRDTFDGPVIARLSPDGTAYLVSGVYLRGSRKYHGVKVWSTKGKPLWDYLLANPSYRASDAWFLAGGRYVGVVAVDYDADGELVVLDSEGRRVMQRSFKEWSFPVMSSDGSWLALFNTRRRTVQVFGGRSLEPVWTGSVAEGATGVFLGDGPELLVLEPGRARLMDERGRVIWQASLSDKVRLQAAFSPDGRWLALTSDDPDSTVYLYNARDGSLRWSRFLVTGGRKGLAFSPDVTRLVVYDVGEYGDIYMLDLASGDILWRFRLRGRPGSTLTVVELQYTPAGDRLVADVVEHTRTDDAYLFYHYLLVMGSDGLALCVSPLGAGIDVEFSAAHGLALLTSNNPIDMYGDMINSVTLVSFSPARAGGK